MSRIGRKIASAAAVLAIAGGGYAFLASNVIDASTAGSGESAVSGYKVSDIHYTLDNGHIGQYSEYASNIASVSFTLDHPAATGNVSAYLTSKTDSNGTTGPYYGAQVADYSNCSQTSGYTDSQHFTCSPTGSEIRTNQVDSLVVNAAQ